LGKEVKRFMIALMILLLFLGASDCCFPLEWELFSGEHGTRKASILLMLLFQLPKGERIADDQIRAA
jgi:hypothetical protein